MGSAGLALAGLAGCGGSSSSTAAAGGSVFSPPAVAPIVNAALPAGLRASSTTVAFREPNMGQHPSGKYAWSWHRPLPHSLQASTRVVKGSKVKFAKTKQDAIHLGHAHPENGLQPATVVDNTNASTAAPYIQYLFQDHFNDINDGQISWQGLLNTQVVQIDERMKDGALQNAYNCLAQTAGSYTIDLSSIDSMTKFTMNSVQCYLTMGSDTTGNTGGMVFGQHGSTCATVTPLPSAGMSPSPISSPSPFAVGNASGGCSFSMQLTLTTDLAAGGFIVAANIDNAGSTNAAAPEAVDGLSVSFNPTVGNSSITVARFRAVPTTNTFEMFYGSNEVPIQGSGAGDGWAGLGMGFRMISDGVHIYSDGKLWSVPPPGGGAWEPYNVCMKASDLSVDATTADCTALANSFGLASTDTLDYCEVTGQTPGCTYYATPPANSGQTAPSATILSALHTAGLVSNASSVAGLASASTVGN
jgi:hypothetical protein